MHFTKTKKKTHSVAKLLSMKTGEEFCSLTDRSFKADCDAITQYWVGKTPPLSNVKSFKLAFGAA